MKRSHKFNRKFGNQAVMEMEMDGNSGLLLQKHQTGRLSAATLRRIEQISAADIIS